ncbi:MAG: hypothetical protein V4580_11225 [Bacteroidota bacterium]
MPRVKEDSKIIISYSSDPRDIYWRKLSDTIISTYGRVKISHHKLVKQVLLDVYDFLIKELDQIIHEEKGFGFYLYVFWLHEQSLDLYFKKLKGYKLQNIDESEFATYRRILKLILEQGCDYNFQWPATPTGTEVLRMDEKIQDILYLGCWAYHIADNIAYQNMVGDYHFIFFDEDSYLGVDYKYHYGHAYELTVKKAVPDYAKGTFDNKAQEELSEAVKKCMNIDFVFSRNQIQEIQKFHSSNGSSLQTIEPYVLPKNLEANGTEIVNAEIYYSGLTISIDNRLSIDQIIRKPYSMQRYFFRPILVYTIEGVKRALVSLNKFDESLMVIATNAIHWNALPDEWLQNKCLKDFMHRKEDEHDKILENEIESDIKKLGLLYDRNIKSLKRFNGNNIVIEHNPGEIDFIIINLNIKKVFVADAKYHRARYEGVGYYSDYSKFVGYEKRMKIKIDWIKGHREQVAEHISIVNNIEALDISDYEIEGVFFINTPTFYMFNGDFKAITLNKIADFISGQFDFPRYQVETDDNIMYLQHPYFRKPVTF